jgi:hypothetical protein
MRPGVSRHPRTGSIGVLATWVPAAHAQGRASSPRGPGGDLGGRFLLWLVPSAHHLSEQVLRTDGCPGGVRNTLGRQRGCDCRTDRRKRGRQRNRQRPPRSPESLPGPDQPAVQREPNEALPTGRATPSEERRWDGRSGTAIRPRQCEPRPTVRLVRQASHFAAKRASERLGANCQCWQPDCTRARLIQLGLAQGPAQDHCRLRE